MLEERISVGIKLKMKTDTAQRHTPEIQARDIVVIRDCLIARVGESYSYFLRY